MSCRDGNPRKGSLDEIVRVLSASAAFPGGAKTGQTASDQALDCGVGLCPIKRAVISALGAKR